jgi:hypothetical protein
MSIATARDDSTTGDSSMIGCAIAFVGLAVGTAAGVDTPFQKVLVVNAAASPIPVTGTVNVGNAPTNQSVTVSNFPTTQSVTVTNLPATQTISGAVKIQDAGLYNDNAVFGGLHTFAFGRTMHVTGLTVTTSDDSLNVYLNTGAPAGSELHEGGSFSRDFTAPVPATGVTISCANLVLDCYAEVNVFGY